MEGQVWYLNWLLFSFWLEAISSGINVWTYSSIFFQNILTKWAELLVIVDFIDKIEFFKILHTDTKFSTGWNFYKIIFTFFDLIILAPQKGVYCFTSVRPSVRPRYSTQQLLMTQIWYLVTSFISWEAFLDLSDSYFLFADFVALNIYAHFSSHFSQQLLMAEIWYLVTSFI